MSRLTVLLFLVLAGCTPQSAEEAWPDQATRIVSLDYCADQFVLKLADRANILALSPDATELFSYMREEAVGLPSVRPVAEDAIILKPDLIVRSYGGGPGATQMFQRAGIPVLNLRFANDFDAIKDGITLSAEGLGVPERGQLVIAEMDQRLAALKAEKSDAEALYMTPAGVTTGPGSLVHDILEAAGFANFQEQRGWRPIPLERLAYETPDAVAAAFFDVQTNHPNAWSPTRHPVAQAQLENRPVIGLEGAWTTCNGWFVMDAVEALANGLSDLPVGTDVP